MGPLYLESVLPLAAGSLCLPVRATAIKTPSGLVVISPVDFSLEQWRRLETLGPVTDIVAPCLIHHLFIPRLLEKFPAARVWGPPDCEAVLPKIPWTHVFGRDPWPYETEISVLPLEGIPRLNEMAFFDRRSKTLIVADLCFNLQNPKGWASGLLLRLLGTYRRFGVSRAIVQLIKDKTAFENSLNQIMRWDFDKIAMSHGDAINARAKTGLVEAFARRGFQIKIY